MVVAVDEGSVVTGLIPVVRVWGYLMGQRTKAAAKKA